MAAVTLGQTVLGRSLWRAAQAAPAISHKPKAQQSEGSSGNWLTLERRTDAVGG